MVDRVASTRCPRRADERHVPCYWIKIAFPDGGERDGNDLQAVLDNEVSATPLQLDMTARPLMPELDSLFAAAQ